MTSPRDLFKILTMTPLEYQVVETGRCPRCHTKTLRSKGVIDLADVELTQCRTCKRVYVLPARRLTG
jgi:ribosomal protein L40E